MGGFEGLYLHICQLNSAFHFISGEFTVDHTSDCKGIEGTLSGKHRNIVLGCKDPKTADVVAVLVGYKYTLNSKGVHSPILQHNGELFGVFAGIDENTGFFCTYVIAVAAAAAEKRDESRHRKIFLFLYIIVYRIFCREKASDIMDI